MERISGMMKMYKIKVENVIQTLFQRRVNNNINKVSLKYSTYGHKFITIVFGK